MKFCQLKGEIQTSEGHYIILQQFYVVLHVSSISQNGCTSICIMPYRLRRFVSRLDEVYGGVSPRVLKAGASSAVCSGAAHLAQHSGPLPGLRTASAHRTRAEATPDAVRLVRSGRTKVGSSPGLEPRTAAAPQTLHSQTDINMSSFIVTWKQLTIIAFKFCKLGIKWVARRNRLSHFSQPMSSFEYRSARGNYN